MSIDTKPATLGVLISRVVEESVELSPLDIARRVVEDTPESDILDFYAEALATHVRTFLSGQRNNAINAHAEAHREVRRGRPVSKKTEAVRDYWQRELDSTIPVGEGVFKRLRDCTVIDLKIAIESRIQHINSVQQKVSHYEKLVSAMELQGAQTVGDLSDPVH